MTTLLIGTWVLGLLRQDPRPDTILSEVNRTYMSLDGYMDWGQVTFSYRSSSGERRGETRYFNTAFKRPNRIRYEFVEPASEVAKEKRWVTWSAFRSGYATWTNWLPNETDRVTLQKSIFRSWGMSESSGLSLKLLVPWALSGPKSTEMFNATLAHDAVNGQACWRVEGVCEDGAQAAIWVDIRSSLVMRYRHAVEAKLDGKPTYEIYTVDLHPQGNPKMEAEALTFIPPNERSSRRRSHRRRHHKG